MELIHFQDLDYHHLGRLALALGEFDGLHIAHQRLIQEAVRFARENGLKSAALTFDPHPDFVLKKRPYQGYITPFSEKMKAMESLGLDYLIVVNFTSEFAGLAPEEFEKNVLSRFLIAKLFVGFDYRYGRRGAGTAERLKGIYPTRVMEEITFKDEKVGSTVIRGLLAEGRTEEAATLLGRFYSITGKVTPGEGVGRTIGYPTANIELAEDYHFLKKGVYAVYVTLGSEKFRGVCNLGHNPTLNYVERPRLEVHILDFNKNIYGREISVEFVRFLRPEIKYDNLADLAEQIKEDIAAAAKILEEA